MHAVRVMDFPPHQLSAVVRLGPNAAWPTLPGAAPQPALPTLLGSASMAQSRLRRELFNQQDPNTRLWSRSDAGRGT